MITLFGWIHGSLLPYLFGLPIVGVNSFHCKTPLRVYDWSDSMCAIARVLVPPRTSINDTYLQNIHAYSSKRIFGNQASLNVPATPAK